MNNPLDITKSGRIVFLILIWKKVACNCSRQRLATDCGQRPLAFQNLKHGPVKVEHSMVEEHAQLFDSKIKTHTQFENPI